MASIQTSLDALRRGDVDAAEVMDTDDWAGITLNGSHARDTWVKTPAGWKRRKHEKLTVNEKMIDGRTVPN